MFVASLFVASAALEKTGITAWAGQALMRGAGDSRWRLIVLMMLFVGVLSALISVNGAVAALLPVVVVLAVRLKRPPSRLLMPLVFGAHAGSMLALTGTPVNVLVLEASLDAGRAGFRLFRVRAGRHPAGDRRPSLIAVVLGERLLPVRESRALPPDLSEHARTLVEQFRLGDGVHQLRVREGSPLVGRRARRARPRGAGRDARHRARGRRGAVRLGEIAEGDVVLVRGDPEAIAALAHDLRPGAARAGTRPAPVEALLFNRASGLAEVLVPPRSPLIGERLFPGMVTPSGDLVVLGGAAAGRGARARPAAGRRATRCCCRAPGRRSTASWRRPRCWW